MKPFEFAPSLNEITDRYPASDQLLEALDTSGYSDRVAIARQWLSEGVPSAFQHCPAVFESLRFWLALKLGVKAKEISLVGSARLGWSLAPRKMGKPFDRESDLDLFVISQSLFPLICEDFCRWNSDYVNGRISPENKNEAEYWRDNSRRGSGLIERGFMDAKLIPTRGGYDRQNIHNTMWELVEKLKATVTEPKIRKASLRCYDSWTSFEDQISRTLKNAAQSRLN
ncbi:MAG: hypothetical protein OYM47_10300 [Gemmatimonadota bacterium]|nr:hypothetical protein [Gemmatimonadota bacterium]